MAYDLKNQLKTSAAAVALVSGLMFPVAGAADQISLKSTDGTIDLVGEFVEFANDTYIIRTSLGDLRISARSVICEGAACPTFDDVTADVAIVGADSVGLGMMPLLMTGFAASLDAEAEITNPSAGESLATLIDDGGFGDEIGTFLVSSTNDNNAFESLLDRSAMIGMTSRRITQDEARALRADGAGSMVSPEQERIIAVDSMVVATHASNPVQTLTQAQLQGIFSGQITNWSQVGGPNKRITVIAQDEDSAGHDYFMSYLFGEERPNFRPQAISPDDQTVSNVLFHDTNAIGYLGYAFQRGAKPVTLVNECGIANTPDAFSAKTEEYELGRRMYLYNRADNLDEKAQQFLDFAISSEADSVIGKSGFIDLGILRRSQAEGDARRAALTNEMTRYDIGFEGEVIGDMLEQMDNYDRLSTTFRFRTGSSRIDERGRLDMERLIDYLEDAPAGTELTFVGFTDDVGAFEGNRQLAMQRAEAVLEEVRAVAGDRLNNITMSTTGYGEIAPSACNVTERGRAINRRVEVWVSKTQES